MCSYSLLQGHLNYDILKKMPTNLFTQKCKLKKLIKKNTTNFKKYKIKLN